jgi:hypothetical protein
MRPRHESRYTTEAATAPRDLFPVCPAKGTHSIRLTQCKGVGSASSLQNALGGEGLCARVRVHVYVGVRECVSRRIE